ncbi:phage tail protein [Photorhabdus luminescens]|uniref:Phage tail protein n=1 Tax=Photorhabdus akhurstii TaxID=171438 RepID=A0ABX8M1H9_9GAMM|nr:phage tail protein [Photorhabdus akhurstii]QXF35258.1 phage tail protein [Photorhabdus akhurstii]UJD77089.1 phage tail protein [Photorhabdus luminescens]
MSIVNKPDYKVFAQDAKSGEIETFPDVLRGWGVTLDRTAGKPPLEWFNAIGKRVDEWLMYLSQRGLAEWDSTVDYPQYAAVQHSGKFYVALKQNISQQPDRSQNNWQLMADFLGAPKLVLDALNTKQDKGDYATNSALNDVRALANTANNNANTKLSKSQNGADIPDKNAFVKNLGLVEAVERANNAVPNSRKINGKALTGDVSLSAGDVGAFPSLPAGQLQNGGKFSDCRECGFYHVFGVNVDTVADFPRYSTSQPLYSYGVLEVYREGPLISQRYTTHFGEIAVRQAFPGNEVLKDWIIHSQHASDLLYNNIPVGVPMPYPHRYTPVGYLTCNGQTFDKSLYPKLAEAYPAGRVPDLRGEFIRGWDDSRGVDPGRVCGTWQGDAIRNITGGFVGGSWDNPTGAFYRTIAIKSYTNYASNDKDLSYINFDASRVVPVASENRPRNIAFNYIVRAI